MNKKFNFHSGKKKALDESNNNRANVVVFEKGLRKILEAWDIIADMESLSELDEDDQISVDETLSYLLGIYNIFKFELSQLKKKEKE